MVDEADGWRRAADYVAEIGRQLRVAQPTGLDPATLVAGIAALLRQEAERVQSTC